MRVSSASWQKDEEQVLGRVASGGVHTLATRSLNRTLRFGFLDPLIRYHQPERTGLGLSSMSTRCSPYCISCDGIQTLREGLIKEGLGGECSLVTESRPNDDLERHGRFLP